MTYRRTVSIALAESVFDRLDQQARFEGITVGMLLERLALAQSRVMLTPRDARIMALHRRKATTAEIGREMKLTNLQVQRVLAKLHLAPNR